MSPFHAKPGWVSVTEAADRADVAQITMRKWVARGRVRSHRTVDGRRLVLVDSLDALLDAHRAPQLTAEAQEIVTGMAGESE
jgi:hypothetical protein